MTASDAEVKNVDLVSKAMGSFGIWQIGILLVIFLARAPTSWHLLASIFFTPPQTYWCNKPPEYALNFTTDEWKNLSLEMSKILGPCSIYDSIVNNSLTNMENRSIVQCESWDFDTSEFTYTVTQQWNLVCNKNELQKLVTATFMFGMLLGSLGIGIIADKFGRKMPIIGCTVIQIATGVGVIFSPNFVVFLILRFILAIAASAVIVVGSVMCMESVGTKHKCLSTTIFHSGFAGGVIIMPAISYILRDWKDFQLAITLPTGVLLIFMWFLPESPRWLISQNRIDEAADVIRKAAKWNKIPMSYVDDAIANEKLKRSTNVEVKAGMIDLIRNPVILLRCLCISYVWTIVGVSFFTLSLFMGQLDGNIFINVAISGANQIPPLFLSVPLANKFGRRNSLGSSYMLAAFSTLVIPAVLGESMPTWPVIMFSALGLSAISFAYPILFLFTSELFPITVRNLAVGFCSMSLRIGSILAPYILGLNIYGNYLPCLVVGITACLSSIVLFAFLPETGKRELTNAPQYVDSATNMNTFQCQVNEAFDNREDFEQTKM